MPNISSSLRPKWSTIAQAQFRDTFRQLHSLDLADF